MIATVRGLSGRGGLGTLTVGGRGLRGGRGGTGIPARLRRMCTHCNETPCRAATTGGRSPRHRSSRIASVRSDGALESGGSVVMPTIYEERTPPALVVTPELTVTRYQWSGDGRDTRSAMRSQERPVLTLTGDPMASQATVSGVTAGKRTFSGLYRFCLGIAGTFRGSGNAGAVSHWGRQYPAPLCPGCESGQRPGSCVQGPIVRRLS